MGLSCAGYVEDGHCRDGKVVTGRSWAVGETYGYPELHCCVCGKPLH